MGGAFEQAWLLLKAAFQPSEGRFIGSGMNQSVYGQAGNPDVVKVGDLSQNPRQLDDMYYHHLLSQLPSLPMFPGQSPIEQTAELPSEVNTASLPMLSTQPRVDGLERSGAGLYADTVRGRKLADALYDIGDQGKLIEAMGLSDLKRENWGATKQGIPEQIVTGEPSQRLVQVHDPSFYSHLDASQEAAEGRGPAPRKLGRDYNIPAGTLEEFARTVDRNPFDKYTEPIEESFYDFSKNPEEGLERLNQRQTAIDDMMASLGL